MSDNLHELAKAAEAKAAGRFDMDAFIESGIRGYRMLMQSVVGLYATDLGGAQESYAASLGKSVADLNEREKRQALLDAILERSE